MTYIYRNAHFQGSCPSGSREFTDLALSCKKYFLLNYALEGTWTVSRSSAVKKMRDLQISAVHTVYYMYKFTFNSCYGCYLKIKCALRRKHISKVQHLCTDLNWIWTIIFLTFHLSLISVKIHNAPLPVTITNGISAQFHGFCGNV